MRPKRKPVNYFHEIQRQSDQEQRQLYVNAMFNPANGYGDLAKHFCVEASRMIDLGIIPHGGDTRVLQRVGLMDRVEHRIHNIN